MAKILLIDDDDGLRCFLKGELEKRDHRVIDLERADKGGVDLLCNGDFHLVLVDEVLPGMSGIEFLKVIRKKGVGIPVILMTGYAKGDIKQAMKTLGASHVVGKPAGGKDEFWKELEPELTIALQGEGEIRAFLGHAIDAALKVGLTNLAPRLRKLLDQELFRALIMAKFDKEEAARIVGVPLAQLLSEDTRQQGSKSKARSHSFLANALFLIRDHPDWTVAEIAQQLGCSKSKLYRDETINRVLQDRNTGNYRPPAGFKDADGDVDAYD